MKKNIEYYISEINRRYKKRCSIFLEIPQKKRRIVFLRLNKNIKFQIINELDNEQRLELLEILDPVDVTNLLQKFNKKTQEFLISELSENIKEQVSLLLKFDKESAGGIMNLDYIQVNSDETILNTTEKFRKHESRTGKSPEIIVLSDDKVVGHIPGYAFGYAGPEEKIEKYIKSIKKVNHKISSKKIIDIFRNNKHKKLVVLDNEKNVVGIIYADDILRLLKEEESSSLYNFAGVKKEEEVTDPARLKIKFRYKWLIINLATSFLAAFTVGLFEKTLNKHVLLAVYMPIVAGMGGNAATQTLAVMVRGIALKQITLKNFTRPLLRELVTGLTNGIINGLLVFTVVLLINKDIVLALVLSIAMISNLIIAAFFGTIVPLLMKSLGKDPASSATIFITTATDVLGFLVFLGLGSFLLG